MYLFATVCYQQIHRCRIRRSVLSVISVHSCCTNSDVLLLLLLFNSSTYKLFWYPRKFNSTNSSSSWESSLLLKLIKGCIPLLLRGKKSWLGAEKLAQFNLKTFNWRRYWCSNGASPYSWPVLQRVFDFQVSIIRIFFFNSVAFRSLDISGN